MGNQLLFTYTHQDMAIFSDQKKEEQAWAELCQAQEKLGLDNLSLPFKKLLLSSI
jgi:hypothetical protein